MAIDDDSGPFRCMNGIRTFVTPSTWSRVMQRSPSALLLCLLGSVALAPGASAQTPVSEWLVLGPMPAPALSGAPAIDSLPEGLLAFEEAWPSEGDPVSWFNGQTFRWCGSREAATPAWSCMPC